MISKNTVESQAPDPQRFLEHSEALQEGLRAGAVAVWRWKIGSEELQWTDNMEEVRQLPDGSFDGTLASFRRDLHPDDADDVWQKINRTIEAGVPFSTVYRTPPRDGGEPRWIETSGKLVTCAGGERYLTGISIDVTARVRGEQELEKRLHQQQSISRFGAFAFGEPDFQKILERAVATAAEVLHVPLSKVLELSDAADHLLLRAGLGWQQGLVGRATVGVELDSQAGYTLMHGGPVFVTDLATETRFSGPQLLREHKVRSGMSVVIPGNETRAFGVFGVHTPEHRIFDKADADFLLAMATIVANSARHFSADEHRQLLVREMAHRAGNMLQLVSTIASQTFGGGADLATALKSFNQRLSSLAQANYTVAKGGWSSTRFVSIAEETLLPFKDRLALKGRDILLPPDLCFDLGLILHELATNSAKYGTFGETSGSVTIAWSVVADGDGVESLNLAWIDPMKTQAPPDGQPGFGSRLLKALIERKWSGSIEIASQDGYRFSLTIPLPRA
jgi:two-component sensor histidine kinase